MSRSDPRTGCDDDASAKAAGAASGGKTAASDAAAAPHAADEALRRLTAERDELRAALSQRESELRTIYDHAPIGMATFDRERRFTGINQRLADINGIAQDEHIGRTVSEIAPGMAEAANASLERVLTSGEPIRHDRVMGFINHHSDEPRVFDIQWYPLERGGEIHGVTVLVDDATEAERGELFARHMVRELQHRVKNSLANVMALVEQAARSARPKEEALQVLKERLSALAQIHGKLTERNWQSIGLDVLVGQEFGREERPSRIDIKGPPVEFGPQSSLAMSMTLHEMAANARRYGGLSCPTGMVSVHWRTVGEGKDAHLFLRWRESGCQPLEERGQPGFGSRLIATSVRNALRGELTEHWLDDGLCVEMKLPLASVGPPEREFSGGVGRPLSPAF